MNIPNQVKIYTDGSCSAGAGGWAAIIQATNYHYELCGGATQTTSLRMELTAIVSALQSLRTPCSVIVYTDCQFIANILSSGKLHSWKERGWRCTTGDEVTNADLWKVLFELTQYHTVELTWVKGHSGHPLNDRCDKLAKAQMRARRDSKCRC